MSKKILLIDDDELVIRSLEKLLARKGYSVDAISDPKAAVQRAAEVSYDLIITDIRMPGMNGIKAIEEIQKDEEKTGRKVNCMVITGYAEEDAPGRAIQLGVTDYLLKPIDLNQFLDAVERNLAGSQEAPTIQPDLNKPYNPDGRWQFPNKEFLYEKLVTLKDTNMEGNVYFANYFAWQGEAREVLLLSHPNFAEEAKKFSHVKLVTHSAYQRFIHESYLGDIIQVKMNSREAKKCSFVLYFKFFNKKNELFLGEGWQRIATVDVRSGKICQVPPHLLDLVLPIVVDEPLPV